MSNVAKKSEDGMERREFQFPASVRGGFDELAHIEGELKRLESRKKALRKYLQDSIPLTDVDERGVEFGVVDGVVHRTFTRPSVSYAKVLDKVKEFLVPKTRWDDVGVIVEEFTSHSEVHKFEEERDEYDY